MNDMTLVEHWDGTQWSIVPSPDSGQASALYGITAISTDDVWAVGDYYTGTKDQTLIEHWDGTQWSLVKSPNKSSFDELYGVAAVSSTDVWAVGDQATAYLQPGKTLIEHWDGTTWHIYKSPNVGLTTEYHTLLGVSAISSSAIMAVGFFGQNNYLAPRNERTMSEYWDGTKWRAHKGANQPICES